MLAQAVAPDPEVLDVPKAQVQAAQGKLDEAIDTLNRVLGASPNDVDTIRLLEQWYGQRALKDKNLSDLYSRRELYTHLNTLIELADIDRLQWGILLYQLGAFTESGIQLKMIQDAEVLKQAGGLIQQLNPRLTSINTLNESVQKAASQQVSKIELLRLRTKQLSAEGNVRTAIYFAEELQRSSIGERLPEDWYQLGHLYGLQGEWALFVEHWPAPVQVTTPWQGMAEYCVSQRNWNTAFAALVKRPLFTGVVPETEAKLSLSQMAIQVKEYQQAGSILQGFIQQFPKRLEPWLLLGEVAIATQQLDLVRTCIRNAQTLGASEEVLQALRDKAGIKEDIADTLAPTIIR